MTKGDVLDGFGPVKVCTHYLYRGEALQNFPADARVLADCQPVYRVLAGWDHTAGVREWDDLDPAFQAYVSYVEKYTGVPIVLTSDGEDRQDTVVCFNLLVPGLEWLGEVLLQA
jgi:adenylosuccinate synthase